MAKGLKVHILFCFRDGPWGGSNQFLKALREQFRALGSWAESPDRADVVMFDSFNDAADVITTRRRLPAVPFVQRIDGPVSAYRGRDRRIDGLIHTLSAAVADGVVFQSHYSQEANLRLGMPEPRRSTVILNAPDRTVFHNEGRKPSADGRIRIVTTSWSSNWNKGFEFYRYLDEALDFGRFSMTFVGNSPIDFRNILHVPPQDAIAIAEILRGADIFLTASRNDPCSNSLAEAIACGLVPVALRSGGHPELVGTGGILFGGEDEVLAAIERAANDLEGYRKALRQRSMAEVAREYINFLASVRASAQPPLRLTAMVACSLRAHLASGWMRGKALSFGRRIQRFTKR